MGRCKTCKYHQPTLPVPAWAVAQRMRAACTHPELISIDTPCPHWYPNEKEYLYEDGIWWHVCKKKPDCYEMNWNDVIWLLSASRVLGPITVVFCPYCGVQLEAMPEEEE